MRKALASVSSVTLLLAMSASPVSTQAQIFHASWEQSSWRVDTAPGVCALVHHIPRFGEARFEQHSGRRLFFSLRAQEPLSGEQAAYIVSEAPPWKHDAASRTLGQFSLQRGKTPMRLPHEQALRIYAELDQGMKPVIAFGDRAHSQDQVRVALSPVRFRQSLPDFINCTASLLHLDFEPLEEKTVYFGSNSDRLSRATRKALEEVARAWRKRRDFRIVLGGYTDDRGTVAYNMRLSRNRTRMVARYLNSRGVPAKLVESRYFGESHPQAAGNDTTARAHNRRVTIWLAGR